MIPNNVVRYATRLTYTTFLESGSVTMYRAEPAG
jgi:hypothetical protein